MSSHDLDFLGKEPLIDSDVPEERIEARSRRRVARLVAERRFAILFYCFQPTVLSTVIQLLPLLLSFTLLVVLVFLNLFLYLACFVPQCITPALPPRVAVGIRVTKC